MVIFKLQITTNSLTMNNINTEFGKITTYLYHYALYLTQNKEAAEDLVQDTALNAVSNQEKFENGTNFKAWTSKIMRNIFVNDYRKKAVRRAVICEADSLQVASTDSGPGENLDIQIINNAIKNLPLKQRSICKLLITGSKYEDIAITMNMPLGSVKSQIFLIRKKLNHQLRELRD